MTGGGLRWQRAYVALCVVVAVWWIFHSPYDPERMAAAMPINAAWVGVHDEPASRLDELLANPLAVAALTAAGVDERDVARYRDDPAVRRVVARLAKRRIIAGYVPEFGAEATPAWLAATWVGGYSQWLNFTYPASPHKDLEPAGRVDGRPTWAGTRPVDADGRVWSVAADSGILFACLSTRRDGVRRMIGRGRAMPRRLAEVDAAKPASGAFDLAMLRGKALSSPPIRYRLTRLERERLSGSVALPSFPELSDARIEAARLRELQPLLGDVPELLIAAPAHVVQAALTGESLPSWAVAVQHVFLEDPDIPLSTPIVLALAGGDHSGRFNPFVTMGAGGKGLKVPTLVAGMRVGNGDKALTSLLRCLQLVNRTSEQDLSARRVHVGDTRLFVIDDADAGHVYSQLPDEQRAAFAIYGDWLVLASNFAVLSKLMSAAESRVTASDSASASWAEAAGEGEQAVAARGWVNGARLAPTLRHAVALYTMLQPFAGGAASQSRRRTMEHIRAALDALPALRQGSFRLRWGADGASLDFDLESRLTGAEITARGRPAGS